MQIPHPANCCSTRTNTRTCSVYIATLCFFSSSSPSFLPVFFFFFFSDRPMTNAWKMAGNILSVEEATFFMVQGRSIFYFFLNRGGGNCTGSSQASYTTVPFCKACACARARTCVAWAHGRVFCSGPPVGGRCIMLFPANGHRTS